MATRSPFSTAPDLALALQSIHGGHWAVEEYHIGGLGEVLCAIDRKSSRSEVLWLDAGGGWWLQYQRRHGEWNVAYTATYTLAQWSALLQEPASGNYTESEVAYMRHPD